MSRFDGARQGIGAWLIGLVVTVVLAVAGALLGAEYNVLERLDLPALPVGDSELATGGALALAVVLAGSLLAAVAGGKAGEQYHRKVDRAGFVTDMEARPAVSGIRRRWVGELSCLRGNARIARNSEAIRLLEADPELGALLSPTRRAEAERELVVRTHRLSVGPWDVTRLSGASADHVGLLVLDGVLARELVVADHVSAELLGPGDLVRPWQSSSAAGLLPVQAVWSVLSSVTLAVLDRRFAAEAARYPEITAALFDRLGERSLRLATTQAISQLTRVDRRLKALFWHLAERWGRVSGDGVVVPLALTHRILGQLVGARRPTVSTALSELAEREELVRRPDGSWLLRGDPPDAQTLARRPTAAELRGQDVLRPSRRFAREGEDVDPDQLIAAMDRLREALGPH